MDKKWTLSASFKHFGAVPLNPRWSWSGKSIDGKTVVITLWKDNLVYGDVPAFYDTFGKTGNKPSKDAGHRELIQNLIWAEENCGGIFRVIIVVAKDLTATPREIFECYPQPKMKMKIVKLNRESGEFRAELIGQLPE